MENEPREPSPRFRFFVSYRRRAEADARLARYLVDTLRAEGHEVFVDFEMPVGIDWSAEIEQRIQWCDYLVVLLSRESVTSEMVQAEVRRAHHNPRGDGSSRIMPVRVGYSSSLGYELDGYLGRLQYLLWEKSDDDVRIAQEILRAARLNRALPTTPDSIPGDRSRLTDPRVPHPKADMLILREGLREPGRALSSDDPFYVRRRPDERVEALADARGKTLVIKAPQQMGKSSLLLRYLDRCLAAGKRVAYLDLLLFGDLARVAFPIFAQEFAQVLVRELNLPGTDVPALDRPNALTAFMEECVLPRLNTPVVIAIDEADRALGSAWHSDFYATLRIWDSKRTHPTGKKQWANVDLALAIATEPKLLIRDAYQSPFNVTPPVTLPPFSRATLDEFNRLYGTGLDAVQLDALFGMVRGHPYLTPLAFYRLAEGEFSFEVLGSSAHDDSGPFGDHLRSKLDLLVVGQLVEAMRAVVLRGAVPGNDRRTFYRLEAAGLAREEGGRVVAANHVYQNFFRTVL